MRLGRLVHPHPARSPATPTLKGEPDCKVRMPEVCHPPRIASTTGLAVFRIACPLPMGRRELNALVKIWARCMLPSAFSLYGLIRRLPSHPSLPSIVIIHVYDV